MPVVYKSIVVGSAVAKSPDATMPTISAKFKPCVSHELPISIKRSALVKTCAITKLILSVYYNARFSAVA